MNYIEPHGHMVSRTTDDYERMALAGCSGHLPMNPRHILGRL
jgi:predicted metal-dependent TIM-barrel fold hydrolase